ncbi:MAG: zinc-dependent alcohol dehydrogenase family protein [Rhodospirillales bacterium]|nr:zinc-dependent alcohol dehydrogenase family protein [Rhodospirillales bacterium]
MQVRAAILEAMGAPRPYTDSRPLKIERIELARPGPGEIRVRIVAAGLCHSDLSVINGDRPRVMPMALGHEAAGVVDELGAGVEDLAVGDHVVLVFVPSCGCCLPCAEGRPALCEPGAKANGAGTLLSGARRIAREGTPVLNHHLGVSGFAEQAVVSRRSAVRVPKDVPLDVAALFGCGVLTGVGAVVNTARVQAGETVAVVGLGGVGLNALLGASAAGARAIVAVDLDPRKLELARTLGATDVVDARAEDAAERVKAIVPGGVDHAFEMAGSVKALDLAFRIAKRGGTTVTAGLPNPSNMLSLSPVTLVAEERTLKGSYVGGAVPLRDIPRYVEMWRRGRLPVDRLMSGRIGFDDLNAAFEKLAAGDVVRQILWLG